MYFSQLQIHPLVMLHNNKRNSFHHVSFTQHNVKSAVSAEGADGTLGEQGLQEAGGWHGVRTSRGLCLPATSHPAQSS